MPLMKELKRLKDTLALSVLVIAHTPKRDSTRPIGINDLAGSKILSNFVDSIFAIGQSGRGTDIRYIKHIKPRSTALDIFATHVAVFRIAKMNGRFLGFEFLHFESERAQLRELRDSYELDLIDRVRQMTNAGKSIRTVAIKLDLAKSKVHRLLKLSEMFPKADEKEISQDMGLLPLEEPEGEPDEFAGIFEKDDEESMAKRRELYLRKCREVKTWEDAIETDGRNEAEPAADVKPVHPLMPPGLVMRLNAYGKKIYVESEEFGKPKIWYQVDGRGYLHRWERKPHGIFGTLITAEGAAG
jgi:hypothetical protein